VLLVATALIVVTHRAEGVEAREALLGRALVALALGILLLNLLLPQVAEFSWQLFGAFLGRREFAIFLPLFLFAIGHAFMRSWPGARAVLAALAVAYLAALVFSVPGAGLELLGSHVDGLGLLLLTLPAVVFAALYLTQHLSSEQTEGAVGLGAGLALAASLAIGWLRGGVNAGVPLVLLQISQLVAGLLFFGLLAQPFFDQRSQARGRSLFASLLIVAFSVGMLHYIAWGNPVGNALDANARQALVEIHGLEEETAYFCPASMRRRFWYWDGFMPETIPYLRLPNDGGEGLKGGLVVLHGSCMLDDANGSQSWDLIGRFGSGEQALELYQLP
jgi:hypothetical protein